MKKMRCPLRMITLFLLLSLSFALVAADEIIPDAATLLLLHLNTNALDSSGNNNHGELKNGADCIVSGVYNQGCSFDGVDDYIEVPHDSDFLTTDGTILFSFKPSVVNKRQGLFSKDALSSATGGQITIRTESDNSIRVFLETTTVSRILSSSSGIVQLGEWHDVAVEFGSGGFKLYINGQLEDDSTYQGGLIGNQEPIVIGASAHRSGTLSSNPQSDHFTGIIDEVAFWDRALTANEIAEIFNAKGFETGEGEENNETEETPTVQLESPLPNEVLNTNNVTVMFSTLDWTVGGKGQTHIHFHLSNQTNFTFDDHFMFYNAPNNIVEFNVVPGVTPFATWVNNNTLQFNNVPDGTYQLRAHLATAAHAPVTNSEADKAIQFTINSSLVITTPVEENNETNTTETVPVPVTNTNSGSNSGGGGSTRRKGGGGCITTWQTGEWGVCVNGFQTRNVTKEMSFCITKDEKPAENQTCVATPVETDLVEENSPTLGSKITGAIVGATSNGRGKVTAVLVLIVLLGGLYFLVWVKK
jgi:hypothetical protein